MEEDILNFTPEEIKSMAETLAKAIASQNISVQPQTIEYTHVICEAEVIAKIDLSAIASSAMGITDILGQISGWITSLANSISSWAVSAVQSYVSGLISGLQNFIDYTIRPLIVSAITGFINNWVMPVIEGVTPKILSYINTYIMPFLQDISPKIASVINVLSGAIANAITSISSSISSGIKSIGDSIASTAKSLSDIISSGIASIGSALTSSIRSVSDAITSSMKSISDTIASSMRTVSGAISSGITTIGNALASSIKSVTDAISSGIATIGNSIASSATTILTALSSGISSLANTISSSITSITSSISTSITTLSESFSRALNNITSSISNLGTTLSTAISNMATSFTNALRTLSNAMSSGFTSLGKLIEPIYTPLSKIATLISSIPENVFTNLRNFLLTFFSTPLEIVAYQIPSEKYLEKIIPSSTPTGEFMSVSPQTIPVIPPVTKAPFTISIIPWINMLENPFGWFCEKIYDTLKGIGETIWNTLIYIANVMYTQVSTTFKVIIDFIGKGIKTLAEIIYAAVANAISTIIGILTGMVNVIKDAMKGVGDTIASLMSGSPSPLDSILNGLTSAFAPIASLIYKPFMTAVPQYIASTVVLPVVRQAKEQFGISSPAELEEGYVQSQTANMFSMAGLVMFSPLMASVGIRALIWNAKAIGSFLENTIFELLIKISPIGIGGEGRFDVAKAVGASVKQFIWELPKLLEHYESGLVYGMAIWLSQPYVKLMNLQIRNIIPIRLPQEQDLIEIQRRFLPRDDAKEMVKIVKYYMAIEGYSDFVINRFMEIDKPSTISVTDRFNYTRIIPLSLVYELPSASDVATMMVRDIFASFDDFSKLYHARGMHPDVGALYYFLRFRYPPPERLWNFTVRGLSGLLWATLPNDERQQISKDVDPIHAFWKPSDLKSPTELNFQSDQLLNSFKTYMKWHDYFRGAWIKGFTSDNLIMVDTLADIPTKIDQRWMMKWGIYETLSDNGVTYTSPIQDFTAKYMSNTPTSNIQMDLTNFSRTILATGIHPYWVPVTAVAETMNALTEERTALRTGFIGFFKEGFYNIDALETMLSGFITTSFKIAYFDIQSAKWVTGFINQPVMFLPPERKLLELRALMDRSLDILREIQKDVSTAYQEFIIWDYNEYKSRLTQVIDSINTFYASDYETITGVKLPEELKLEFVEDYYKPYVEALRIWRDVFTIRRARLWTQRWIGWVMYRVAYGGVKKEDVEKLVTYVSSKAKLTDYETDFIRNVMELMYGIARQSTILEYQPTPSTMATLSEYMTLDINLVKQVLVERGLDEIWQKIWLTYITVRPIKADAKALLSTYVKAFRYEVVTKAALDEYVSTLPQYGFTAKEIELITKSIDLEEQILDAQTAKTEYIPAPLTLASICEYLPEAREFYSDVVQAKRIPKRWQELWARYIDIRPLVDDIKRYVSNAEALYVHFMTKKGDFEKILKEASGYLGHTSKEIEFLMKVTEFERYRNAWSELIGSVQRLVELSEYSPKASEYALGKLYEMIDALPLPDSDKIKLKAMWEEYIRNRPVKAEAKTYITQLINMYVEGLMDTLTFKKELGEMAKWGFSQDELMFYEAQASLRKARKLKIPVGE